MCHPGVVNDRAAFDRFLAGLPAPVAEPVGAAAVRALPAAAVDDRRRDARSLMLLASERRAIVAFARRLGPDGLSVGTSGNLSVRAGELVAVTPSGVPYEQLEPEQVGVHRLDGTPEEAPLKATSELPLHLAVHAALAGDQAVVHTHAPAATALSTLVGETPAVHYALADLGGPVRVARYATFGTPELAANCVAALEGRAGVLLANHGTVTTGPTLAKAYERAQVLEWVCDVYLRARAAGDPRLLDQAELDRVARGLEDYGQ